MGKKTYVILKNIFRSIPAIILGIPNAMLKKIKTEVNYLTIFRESWRKGVSVVHLRKVQREIMKEYLENYGSNFQEEFLKNLFGRP